VLDTVESPKYTGARKNGNFGGRETPRAPVGGTKMERFTRNRKVYVGATFVAILLALGVGQMIATQSASAQAKQAPKFEVDPFWPKPMPNNWVLGQTIGLTVDDRDHVWLIHRGNDPGTAGLDRTELAFPTEGGPRVSECCVAAPPVLEFDQAGNLVGSWGGKAKDGSYTWPESNHGVVVDHKGFVWIGGNGPPDSHILKFTRDGKFVAQYGKAGARKDPASPEAKPVYRANSQDMDNFGRVAKIFIDPKANEGYVSDGYLNHRVAVIDLDTGKIKRMWGAYGEPPTDENLGPYDPSAPPAKQFRNPMHCAVVSDDGLVYTCDRPNDRVQIFTKEGKFVKEVFVEKQTRTDGSVWDIAFSKDPQQTYLYMADGCNEHVRVFDRKSMEELYNFGYGGRQPGMFLGVHSIAVDSKGNIYTTETYTGKRLQKFTMKGMASVSTLKKATPPWPGM
jgi:DNA-binding beta-propeller fold protein YncE